MATSADKNVTAASVLLGATAGLATAVFGAPLWAAIGVGSAAAYATKKAIDKATTV
jgi:hypothetical protein